MRRRKYREYTLSMLNMRAIETMEILIHNYRYKVGDCFVSLPQPQVLELLESSTGTIDTEVEALKSKLEGVQEEMGELKKALYGRFGRSINLET
jgi:chaperonin cofactor prefoldin